MGSERLLNLVLAITFGVYLGSLLFQLAAIRSLLRHANGALYVAGGLTAICAVWLLNHESDDYE